MHRMSFVYLQATQLPSCPKKLDLSKGGLSRVPDSAIAFPAIEELVLSCNNITNVDNNLKLLHRYAYFIFTLRIAFILNIMKKFILNSFISTTASVFL